ncbi:MAG: hypothetical protein CMJ48_04225 [Planctomycetaceae bacterium]|nr:hypothetical protein [Planctomycetaceae bacterium]
MRLPVIRGVIDRRILANFRVAPDVLAQVVPAPFRPQLVNGFGIAGICLIRLKQVRPRLFPSCIGISSENAAHRIAVEWDAGGELCTGVFVPRRDTSSLLNVMAGGRVFPGLQNRARFDVSEDEGHFRVGMESCDGSTRLKIDGQVASELPSDSVFSSADDVSEFFESGSLGYSPDASGDRFDGLELHSFNWSVEPLAVNSVESSFFDDRNLFPQGSVTFDNALLMRGIDHEWHVRESLCC